MTVKDTKQNGFTIAVVGATGLVGQKMIQVLEERHFPLNRLIPIASEKSLEHSVSFQNKNYQIQSLNQNAFRYADIALFSAGKSVSKEFAPIAAKQEAVVIDNSSAWRTEPEIPLVVPEVNAHALQNHHGIIANPNCSTIQMVVALYPLHREFKIKRVVVSTYQAVSGSGKQAVRQLEDEINNRENVNRFYPHPIANNCLPHIDVFNPSGYSREEMKMIFETRKIMDLPDLAITATTVRVPVHTGHSESINIEFEEPFSLDEIRKILRGSPGIILEDNPAQSVYPMPLFARGRNEVFVGRIRRDESINNGLNIWVVSDNLRKGAATNAVQIAELLIQRNLLTNK